MFKDRIKNAHPCFFKQLKPEKFILNNGRYIWIVACKMLGLIHMEFILIHMEQEFPIIEILVLKMVHDFHNLQIDYLFGLIFTRCVWMHTIFFAIQLCVVLDKMNILSKYSPFDLHKDILRPSWSSSNLHSCVINVYFVECYWYCLMMTSMPFWIINLLLSCLDPLATTCPSLEKLICSYKAFMSSCWNHCIFMNP
jgi:hypothetical protein